MFFLTLFSLFFFVSDLSSASLFRRLRCASLSLAMPRFHVASSSYGSTDECIFAEATRNEAFSRMLKQEDGEDIRKSFLEALVPGLELESVDLASGYFRTMREYDKARDFLSSQQTKEIIDRLRKDAADPLLLLDSVERREGKIASNFREGLTSSFDALREALSIPFRRGLVDFICHTKGMKGTPIGKIFVEVQVVPQDFWDQRAMYYSSLIFASQLRRAQALSKDGPWDQLMPVLSINLLGGQSIKNSWRDRPELKRHYKFVDVYKIGRALDKGCRLKRATLDAHSMPVSIEIMQYHLQNVPEEKPKYMSDVSFAWLDLMRFSSFKTEREMDSIVCKLDPLYQNPLRRAYELLRLSKFTEKERSQYTRESFERVNFRSYIEEGREEGRKEGREEGKIEIARSMKKDGISIEIIRKHTGLSEEEIYEL